MKRFYVVLAGLGAITLIIVAFAIGISRSPGSAASASGERFSALAANGVNPDAAPAANKSGKSDIEVEAPEKFDLSRPLSEMGALPPAQGEQENEDNKVLPGRPNGTGPGNTGVADPARQAATNGPVSLNVAAPLTSFEGVSNLSGVLPPDTNGDVGPNHYMQWVNLNFAIYSKTGALLFGPAAGNSLWAGFGGPCQTRNDGDPIVQYDHLADRWMVSQFALPGGSSGYHQCIAVSQTPDPTGAWYRYDFLYSSTNMNDYPHFGVWPDGYYMTVHEFAGGVTWAGQGVAVFERSQMLAGGAARMVKFNLFSTDPNMGGMLPSDLDGPAPAAGTPNYFVEPDDNSAGFPQDQVQVWAFHVDWTNTANSTFTKVAGLATAAFDSNMCNGARACIPQQGTTAKLDAISDRAMYRAQYRNFGSYQTLVLNHTVDASGTDIAGVRWYELRNSGSGWNIFQQSTFSPDSTNRWMASIAMNGHGDIGLGYSASSSSMFPAIRYTGRLASDPLNAMTQGEGVLMAGTGAQTHTAARWGDYSMLAVDPVDDCTFWYTNEYVATTGSAPWRTRIGSFKLADCGPATTGTISGAVTDSATSAPISGATVTIVGGASTTTNASGAYTFSNVTPGTYSLTASAAGYNGGTNNGVSVTAGATTTSDFALVALPPTTGTIAGTVTNSVTSAPISGATVTIVGGASTTTNASGAYSIGNVSPGTYDVTASANGFTSATNTGVSVTAGATTTSNFALAPNAVANTGFAAPTANAAVTSSAGDNNGYQTSPTNAYAADGLFAVDTNSGNGTSTSCTSNAKDKHIFYNYNFNLSGTAVVKGIEVKLTGKADSTSGAPKFCIQLSYNGGTTWTTAKSTTTLSTTNTAFTLGTSSDTWGRAWAPGEFSNGSFRVRIIDVSSNTSRDFSLDAIAVQVTYQP